MDRNISKEEKAKLFRDQTTQLLTPAESKAVKIALARFMKEKNAEVLVSNLESQLDTPAKHILYDTIALFIPSKFVGRYSELANEKKGTPSSPLPTSSPTSPPPPQPPTRGSSVKAPGPPPPRRQSSQLSVPPPTNSVDLEAEVQAEKRAAAEKAEKERLAQEQEQEQETQREEEARQTAQREAAAAEEERKRVEAEAEAQRQREADAEAARQKEEVEQRERALQQQQQEQEQERLRSEQEEKEKQQRQKEKEDAKQKAAAEEEQRQAAQKAQEEEDLKHFEEARQQQQQQQTPSISISIAETTTQTSSTDEPQAQLQTSQEDKQSIQQARINARRDKQRLMEQRAREEEAQDKEKELAGVNIRSNRRGTMMGKKGGVSAIKDRIARLSQINLAPVRSNSEVLQEGDDSDGNGAQLRSRRGMTVVGRKNLVSERRRSHLQSIDRGSRALTISEQLEAAEAAEGVRNKGKIVFYTTTVSVTIETKTACAAMRKMLQRLRVSFEEKNIYMSKQFALELKERLPGKTVPQCFFNGKHLGNFETILVMNETAELQKLTAHMKKFENLITGDCEDCGGQGFIVCPECGGDKKSVRMRFGRNPLSLKCTACNENGLMVCRSCITTSTHA